MTESKLNPVTNFFILKDIASYLYNCKRFLAWSLCCDSMLSLEFTATASVYVIT